MCYSLISISAGSFSTKRISWSFLSYLHLHFCKVPYYFFSHSSIEGRLLTKILQRKKQTPPLQSGCNQTSHKKRASNRPLILPGFPSFRVLSLRFLFVHISFAGFPFIPIPFTGSPSIPTPFASIHAFGLDFPDSHERPGADSCFFAYFSC